MRRTRSPTPRGDKDVSRRRHYAGHGYGRDGRNTRSPTPRGDKDVSRRRHYAGHGYGRDGRNTRSPTPRGDKDVSRRRHYAGHGYGRDGRNTRSPTPRGVLLHQDVDPQRQGLPEPARGGSRAIRSPTPRGVLLHQDVDPQRQGPPEPARGGSRATRSPTPRGVLLHQDVDPQRQGLPEPARGGSRATRSPTPKSLGGGRGSATRPTISSPGKPRLKDVSTLGSPIGRDRSMSVETIDSSSDERPASTNNKADKKFEDFKAEVFQNKRTRSGKAPIGEGNDSDPFDSEYQPDKKKIASSTVKSKTGPGRPANSRNRGQTKADLAEELRKTKEELENQKKIAEELRGKLEDADFDLSYSAYVPLKKSSNHPKLFHSKQELLDELVQRDLGVDQKHIEAVVATSLTMGKKVQWEDIQGLEGVKSSVYESACWPMLRPDIFADGTLQPSRGVLLFGPPGTGKTMLARCVASNCNSNFFALTTSTVVSKWVGEGEKIVKALFAVAREVSPSVIFIDEMESIFAARGEKKCESSQRLLTEFLAQMEGVDFDDTKRVLVIGATNRPGLIDDAVLRRFPSRLYVPLPDLEDRIALISHCLKGVNHTLTDKDIRHIAINTKDYSGSDLKQLAVAARMATLRTMPKETFLTIAKDEVPKVGLRDMVESLKKVKPSVNKSLLKDYQKFHDMFGSS